jgi:hypothetical protein
MCISLYNIFSKIKVSKGVFKSYENICACKNVDSLHVYSFAVQKPILNSSSLFVVPNCIYIVILALQLEIS